MGGGDLNMKKSWHPLLLKNQERVWLEEKKALEERKKLDQLRKEKEEERQLQELQRLQEEKTGKKRAEKLEWMYSTPATGNSANPNELEDYLLGKKRVDKILTADDNAKLGSAHKNFIAVQNANTARDIAAKIREDPLLAIKQQEQAAYQALISNPLRLRQLKERNGIKTQDKKEKKDKKERKRAREAKKLLKEESRKHRSDSRSSSPTFKPRSHLDRRRSLSRGYGPSRRSPSPYRNHSRSPLRHRDQYDGKGQVRLSAQRGRSRTLSPEVHHRRRSRSGSFDRKGKGRASNGLVRTCPSSDEPDDIGHHKRQGRSTSRSYSPNRDFRREDNGKRHRPPSPSPPDYRDSQVKRQRLTPPLPRSPVRTNRMANNVPKGPTSSATDERAARLAAMSSNASALTIERQERLKSMLEKEKADLEAEERARAKSRGMGGFLSGEQKKVFGGVGDLEDRIRRGRGGMVVDAD